jgi:hypothetical protein
MPGSLGRGGTLKMYWTKPGPVIAGRLTSPYPNRRVSGTNFDLIGIDSLGGLWRQWVTVKTR